MTGLPRDRSRPSWVVSVLSLVILVPVGLTVWFVLRVASQVDNLWADAGLVAYALLGVLLMLRRVRGVWRQRVG